MTHAFLSKLVGITAVVTLLNSPLWANDALTGSWRHAPLASDENYISGEYPGRLLEIAVLADRVRITQTLGAVKNGVALRGSGDKSQTFELPTDGSRHEIPFGTSMTRTAHATWETGALHFTYLLGENAQLGFEEIWRVSEDGQTLTIERRRLRDDKLRILVFVRS